MVEEKAGDMLNELENRLQIFEFKSTSLPLDKWDGTSIINKVYNREKLRLYKSKEEQLLNRLDLWIDVCRIGKRTLNTDLDNGKFSSVKLCKIKKPLLRRTNNLESINNSSISSDISCATKLSGTSNKKRSKTYDGFFRSRTRLCATASAHDLPVSKHDITVEIKLSDSSSMDGHDQHDYLETNQKTKRHSLFNIFCRKPEGCKSEETKSEDGKMWTRTQNIYRIEDDKDHSLKSFTNITELSHQINLLPSKFHVDTLSNTPGTRKSFKNKRILAESTPVTRNHDKCNSSSNNKQNVDSICTHNADSNDKCNTDPYFYKCDTDPYLYKCNTDLNFYKCNPYQNFYKCNTNPNYYKRSNCLNDKNNTYSTENDDNGLNPYNRTSQNMTKYETYHMNKMRYFKENTQNQNIRTSADISTIQDYVDSIKESRSSIKQCTKDIKKFLGSSSNITKNENINPVLSQEATPAIKKQSFLSGSTPDIGKLLSREDRITKRSLFSKENCSHSWSDVKCILQDEYIEYV